MAFCQAEAHEEAVARRTYAKVTHPTQVGLISGTAVEFVATFRPVPSGLMTWIYGDSKGSGIAGALTIAVPSKQPDRNLQKASETARNSLHNELPQIKMQQREEYSPNSQNKTASPLFRRSGCTYEQSKLQMIQGQFLPMSTLKNWAASPAGPWGFLIELVETGTRHAQGGDQGGRKVIVQKFIGL